VSAVSNTMVDVTISHGVGTDFTPTTGITALSLLDGSGAVQALASAVRLNANTVRLITTAPFLGIPSVRSGYGADPDVTGVLRDNSTLTIPLAGTLAAGIAGSATPIRIVTDAFTDPVSNAVLVSTTIPRVLVVNPANGNVLLSLTGQVTATDGKLTITDPSLVSGTTYLVVAFNSTGASRGAKSFVAG